ncbi:hypothetical protein SS1G_01591 [Sclerotinia sclerotiorum 1980 UF-70]|uniref:NmrA-like domain-containing protein n=2 Tax=Sclerotinia sclerotiorum (strain ATCC 18683 / 1980 / Ss-1) TaxID=665079 RepID=A7E8G3_SCLS1|nr:hypothetical protein SS1G_01591 [Sclerotinia sclerotiorum 1980 UF-70]APA05996.1 hypothetical protein sscle_01g007660 [Sclerotinia sclerotiorum 1980 UF-70]EDN96665.1 hypothetical protein SS1G_01591 [Sclerotinia sclerotiorum 1980 UF-70]
MSNTFLITGATGKQGGAAIDALLSAPGSPDIIIFALTRNLESTAAEKLSKKSDKIKLLQGDLDDCPAIFEAAPQPIKRVFCVTMPNIGLGNTGATEEGKGKALIDASIKHGVEHFIFTSVDRHGDDSDNDPTNVPHFISKANIEKYLKEKSAGTQMSWTILRPVAFMENFAPGFAGKVFATAWCTALAPTTKLQLVATADIGYFAAQALLKPKEYNGRAISLAGDELTFGEANEIFQSRLGKDIPKTFSFLGSTLLWAVKDFGSMFTWFEERGYAANIDALKKEHAGLQSFGDWLKTSGL